MPAAFTALCSSGDIYILALAMCALYTYGGGGGNQGVGKVAAAGHRRHDPTSLQQATVGPAGRPVFR